MTLNTQTKPGVDWAEIEKLVRKGESFSAIARKFPISAVRISQRSREMGWREPEKSTKLISAEKRAEKFGPIAALNEEVTRRYFAAVRDLPLPERLPLAQVAFALARLSIGAPERVAVEARGLSLELWTKAREEIREFDSIVRAAAATQAEIHLDNIGRHSARDWKASQFLLERGDLGEHFREKRDEKSTAVLVQINVVRDENAAIAAGVKMIESPAAPSEIVTIDQPPAPKEKLSKEEIFE